MQIESTSIGNNVLQKYLTYINNAEWKILAHLIPEAKRVVIPTPLISDKFVTRYIPRKTKAFSNKFEKAFV
ncbi:hypothetical protein COO91_07650 [Nostoc flagelliforme CCNUN1]|uniref:Uncharacterized protein n=1 Tax=Nostoc flagelliforme CCNUN1 TaxID=2038116 RepID=A0A2K8T1U6_9NOSO|nr:hypothetical protein COO91_07650 [Nostoc flagelliforme CCNUN1]